MDASVGDTESYNNNIMLCNLDNYIINLTDALF